MYKLIAFVFIFLLSSCGSTKDFVGSYKNKSDDTVVLVLNDNYTYQYLKNGELFNAGTWDDKNEGWSKINFKGWKDLPSFDLLNCKTECFAIVIYDGGELIFQPDDHSINFIK